MTYDKDVCFGYQFKQYIDLKILIQIDHLFKINILNFNLDNLLPQNISLSKIFTINSISFIDLSISSDKIFIISSNNLLT